MRNVKQGIVLFGAVMFTMGGTALAQFTATERISEKSPTEQANADSSISMVSADLEGRYVVFESLADNLAPKNTLGFSGVFVKDRVSSEISLASVTHAGNEAEGRSQAASISSDGRYVLFSSDAPNLVLGDSNDARDVFLRDMQLGETSRVSLRDGGTAQIAGDSFSPRMSDDARFVVFVSAAAGIQPGIPAGINHVYIRDRVLETTTLLSIREDGVRGNRDSANPVISPDGRFVVFESRANLVAGFNDDENSNIFLRDLQLGTIERISQGRTGGRSNGDSTRADVSHDGRFVVFSSIADNIVVNDSNAVSDIFLWDRESQTPNRTIRISTRGSVQANGASDTARISGDGEFVVFHSTATNLVTGSGNDVSGIYAYDVSQATVRRVSRTETGQPLNGAAVLPSINLNGQFVSYTTNASNLVQPKRNDTADVYLVNAQCLLNPATGTPPDTDGDGTNDCLDGCPTDPLKTSPGICGCGVPDVDSDGDGVPDCIDECPFDPNKSVAGACGCDEEDSDTNGSGAPDCLDPKPDSILREIIVERLRRGRARVYIPTQFPNARYQVIVRQRGRVLRRLRTRERIVLRRLNPGQRYAVSYRAFVPEGGFTRESRRRVFRARGRR